MTPADFIAAFPMFADEEVPTVQRWIDAAMGPMGDGDPWFEPSVWGSLLNQGLGNWVAHQIVMEHFNKHSRHTAALAGMPMVQKTVDQVVSERYSEALLAMSAKDPFMRTTYGQMYRYLVRIAGGGAVST